MAGIYAIINTLNNKLYIGSTVREFNLRWRQHLTKLNKNNHHSTHLQASWNKYGADVFNFIVLEVIDSSDAAYYIEREQHYLDLHQSYDRANGYNVCRVAGRTTGFKHSEETRRKMSASKKGNKYCLGVTQSAETRAKRAAALRGKSRQPESTAKTVEKIAKTYTMLSPEGKEVTFTNMAAFCRSLGLDKRNLHAVYNGKDLSYKGWRKVIYRDTLN